MLVYYNYNYSILHFKMKHRMSVFDINMFGICQTGLVV